MGFYQLLRTQELPTTIGQVWDFIASPKNLTEITPDYMRFKVTGNTGQGTMYPGMIITYKVSPLPGMRLNWMTEITEVKEGEYFIDEQRSGPYRLWHHEHKLESVPGGVRMTDLITYIPPLGWLGDIAHALFIRKQLEGIFEYRHRVLEKKFGKIGG